jgi:poly(A) polymerase
MKFNFFEVGGKVRDEILGIQSKDVDYVAVPSDDLINEIKFPNEMFNILESFLREEGYEIFLVTSDCYTIRAKFPNNHVYSGVADFVMARKEVGYISGTRTPIIKPGTLFDDLERRDFTLNALAKKPDGTIVDYFNGLEDLRNGILRTPLPANQTFDDDPLRILRAIRFSVTKNFKLSSDIHFAIHQYDYEGKMSVVSDERIREELFKCFKKDTLQTINILNKYFTLRDYVFTKTNLWLKPTFEL